MALTIEAQTVPLTVDQDGVMRVGQTRVTLDTVVHAFDQGHTAEEIVSHYPALRLADVYAVISYYLNNEADVRTYLRQQTKMANEIWDEIETKSDYQMFRKRLAARFQSKTGHFAECSSASEWVNQIQRLPI